MKAACLENGSFWVSFIVHLINIELYFYVSGPVKSAMPLPESQGQRVLKMELLEKQPHLLGEEDLGLSICEHLWSTVFFIPKLGWDFLYM